MNQTQYIPDLVEDVVAKVSTTFSTRLTNPFTVQFYTGPHEEVLALLQAKEENPTKPVKYPFIWLVTREKVNPNEYDDTGTTELHFLIVQDSNQNYFMDDRRDNTIKPFLLPIYDEFVYQIKEDYQNFNTRFKGSRIEYTIVPKAKLQTEANLFQDVTDAIDVKWRLKVKNICVTT